MIFLVCTLDEEQNRQLKSEVRSLGHQHKSHQYSNSQSDNKPLQNLKSGEVFFIVGHGNRQQPSLSDLNAKQLLDCLKLSGFNPYLKSLKIQLICCHAGYKKNRLTKSFAELFFDELLDCLNDARHRLAENSLPIVTALSI